MEIEIEALERFVGEFLASHTPVDTQWCVITGAPSSGKTSVINALAQKGFRINTDISREYLESQIAGGLSKHEARRSEEDLQRVLFLLMVKNASQLPIDEIIFHDYFLPDNVAFQRMANLAVANEVLRSAEAFRLWKVFIMEPVEFQTDHVRTEDFDYQQRITAELEVVYADLGYQTIRVPLLSIDERTKFIVKELER